MKRLLFILSLLLVLCSRANAVLPAVCNTVSSDNFTRANENPLTNHSYWATQTSNQNLQVSSNLALGTSTTGASRAIWLQAWYPNDQCSTLTINAIAATSFIGVNVRGSFGASTSYEFIVTPTTYILRKIVAGVATNIKTGLGTFATTNVIAVTAVGTTITGYLNGTSVDSGTDSSITMGSPGFTLFDSSSTANAKASLWTGGGASGGVWTKLGPIIPPNATDNGGALGGTSNGAALYEGNSQLGFTGNVFKMWFQGRNDLFYAESVDAVHWTRRATALLTNVGLPKVFKNSGTYYLYASATPTCTTCVVSSYTSSDGITWNLQVATALGHGIAGHFDEKSVQYLMPFHFAAGTWYASYSGVNNSSVGGASVATSTDLLNWTNGASTALFAGGAPDTHEISGVFYSWTGAASNDEAGNTGFGGARTQSNDMITWSALSLTLPRTLFMEGMFMTANDGALGPQNLVEANGNVYNFYTGTRAENVGLGYVQMAAVATGQTLATLVGTSEGPVFPQTDPQLVNYCTSPTVSDNFTRANETPLSNSGNWSIAFTPNVQINLASNNAVATSTSQLSHMIWTGRNWSPNQCSQQTLSGFATATSSAGLSVRAASGASTFYEFVVSGTTYNMIKRVAGTGTTIFGSNNTNPFVLGDTLIFNITGSTITGYKSGSGILTMISQVSDSSITSGSPGIILFDSATAANSKASAWQAGQGSNGSGVSAIVVP